MRCHYCGRSAAYEASTNGVTVGLCARHLSTEMAEIPRREPVRSIREALDA